MSANGYLPLSSLTRVDGWAYLEPNTAHGWVAFCNEMVSLGFARPTISAPDGAYRTYAQQQYWLTYWTARGLPGNASTPGFSNHGWGTCVDVWDVHKWPTDVLMTVMNKHGFVHDFAPEAWHFHHTSIDPADNTSMAGVSSTPIPPVIALLKEDTMKLITHPNGQPALVGEFTFLQIAASTMTDLEAYCGPHIPVSATAWTFLSQTILENRAVAGATAVR